MKEKQLSPRQDLLLTIEIIHINLNAQLAQLIPYLKNFADSKEVLPASSLDALIQMADHIELMEPLYRKSYKAKVYKLTQDALIKRRTAQIEPMVKDIRKNNKELKQAVNAAAEFNINQEILDALDEKVELVKTLVSLLRKVSIGLIN